MSPGMSREQRGIVIVGAGLAGVRTAEKLRDLGYPGRIRLLSEEEEHPYDRPPLSKDFLVGKRGEETIRLSPPGQYAAQGIELELGTRVTGVDPRSGTLGLADGTEVGYQQLVVATGARPRPLEALPPSAAVHYLRTADDARRLAAALTPGARVAVIGAGFIGLEVASAALSLGGTATVVEMAALPLAGVVGTGPARWLRSWHAARGVEFRCGVTVMDGSRPGRCPATAAQRRDRGRRRRGGRRGRGHPRDGLAVLGRTRRSPRARVRPGRTDRPARNPRRGRRGVPGTTRPGAARSRTGPPRPTAPPAPPKLSSAASPRRSRTMVSSGRTRLISACSSPGGPRRTR